MKQYIGLRIVHAEPMTLGEYYKFRGWNHCSKECSDEGGYRILFPDDNINISNNTYFSWTPEGYVSWITKDTFEAMYKDIGEDKLHILFSTDSKTLQGGK